MKKSVLYLISFAIGNMLVAQYSYMDVGVMRMNYRNKGPLKDAWWPGFTIQCAQFQFSRYAGEVSVRDTSSSIPADWKPHGTYWSVGYIHSFTKFLNRSDKRPILTPSLGAAIGNWRTHAGGSVFSLSLSGDGAINILPGVSLIAGAETGINFKGLFGVDYGPLDPIVNNVQSAFPRFYFNPKFGIRLYYDFKKALGKEITEYVEPGWRTSYSYSNGWRYYRNYWDKGGMVTKVITTKEIITVAPTIYFPKASDGYGVTKAAGAKLTLRYGIFASDLQYIKGQIGFHLNDGSFAGGIQQQCFWDYEGFNGSLGINIFSWRGAFQQSSIIRFILGKRFGIANIHSNYRGPGTQILPPEYSGKNVKTNHFFMAAELGRLGLSWDFMKNPERKYEGSGGLISAYYMIPLVKGKGN